jgi:hypothetical protein
LVANRWEPFVHVFRFEGQGLTGATFAAEVRDRKDGGFARAVLATVGSAGTEGITLVSVANEDVDFGGDIGVVNVPVSTVSMRINEPTMEAMGTAHLAAGAAEVGDDGSIWWDMQITPAGGVKYRALEGQFTVKAGVTGSSA